VKRVEANIQTEKLHDVIKAIRKVGVGGITVHQCQGQGAREPPLVGDFYSRTVVTVIVEDEKADDIMEAVSETCCTCSQGDGKIYVSNIEEITDICTKEKEIFEVA
jgi:nitrogen regulatory protein P-II 1